jgi:LysR family glycine cleavage system transcriptional activator
MAIRRSLPPLQLLQAFEVAGRLLSFKRAAEELHVTPSAISQQIKSLEDSLGIVLFERIVRGLRLTDAGRAYWQDVHDALTQLRVGTMQLADRFGQSVLRVSIIPFIANEVVIPALHAFQEQYPEIELRIETSPNTLSFQEEEIDMAVRVGLGKWTGFVSEKIRDIIVTPVCSPALAKRACWKSLADLSGETFINVSTNPDHWQEVAHAAGLDSLQPGNVLIFDSYYAAMSAAEKGLGVALGLFPLTTSWVASGRLAAPFSVRAMVAEAHHIIFRNGSHTRQECRVFRDWIVEQFSLLTPLDELKVAS